MTRSSFRDPEWWSRVALVVASVGAAAIAAFVVRLIATSLFDFQLVHEAMEPAALFSARALGEGGIAAAYPADWAAAENPLILTPYPPLFHFVWLALAWVFGGFGTYLPGRLIADIALAGVVVLIYACARTQKVGRLTALPFALIFLTPIPVAVWAGVARVDVPGIALTVLGFWVYLRTADRDDRSYLLASIPFILAGLTKQNLIAAPAAVIFAEVFRRRMGRAAMLSLATGGGVVAVFAVLNLVTAGGFLNATFSSLADEIFFAAGAGLAFDFLLSSWTLVALSLLTLSVLILRRVEQPAIILYVGTTLFVLGMTIGKPGSNVNYYLEPIAALCIAASVGLWTLRDKSIRIGAVAAALVALAIVATGLRDVPQYRTRYRSKTYAIENQEKGYQIPAYIRDAGPVMAPPGYYLLFGEPRPTLYTNDMYTFGAMAAWGKLFDAQKVVEDFRTHRISAVFVPPPMLKDYDFLFIGDWQRGWNFWSVPGFKQALIESYDYTGEAPLGLLMFVPKTAPDEEAAQ